MTSDLGQKFNLRKTAATSPPAPADSTKKAAATPTRRDPTTATEPDVTSPPPSQQPRHRRAATTNTRTKPAKQTTTPITQATASTSKSHPEPSADRGAETADSRSVTQAPQVGGEAAIHSDAAPAGESSPRSATSTGGRASIMLYTTQTVRERMKEEAQLISLSYGQLTLYCIENTLERLGPVFAARVGATSQLFSTNYKPRSRGETRSANLNLHIANRDLDVVESLWQSFPGCRSRNDLLSTACALYLTGEADT